MAYNVEMKTTGKQLIITVDLSKSLGASKSGKTEIISSTQGNVSVPGANDVKIGLNIYKARQL